MGSCRCFWAIFWGRYSGMCAWKGQVKWLLLNLIWYGLLFDVTLYIYCLKNVPMILSLSPHFSQIVFSSSCYSIFVLMNIQDLGLWGHILGLSILLVCFFENKWDLKDISDNHSSLTTPSLAMPLHCQSSALHILFLTRYSGLAVCVFLTMIFGSRLAWWL